MEQACSTMSCLMGLICQKSTCSLLETVLQCHWKAETGIRGIAGKAIIIEDRKNDGYFR